MELDFSNTPMNGIKAKKCFHCKGRRDRGFYCWLLPDKKQLLYFYPCSVLNQLICPRVKKDDVHLIGQ